MEDYIFYSIDCDDDLRYMGVILLELLHEGKISVYDYKNFILSLAGMI